MKNYLEIPRKSSNFDALEIIWQRFQNGMDRNVYHKAITYRTILLQDGKSIFYVDILHRKSDTTFCAWEAWGTCSTYWRHKEFKAVVRERSSSVARDRLNRRLDQFDIYIWRVSMNRKRFWNAVDYKMASLMDLRTYINLYYIIYICL